MDGRAHLNAGSFERVIEEIYAAAVSPARWRDVLDEMRAILGLTFAASVTRSLDRTRVAGVASGVDDDDYQAYMRTFFAGSVFGRNPENAVPGTVALAGSFVPLRRFHETEMYQSFWRPRDLSEALHLGVSLQPDGTWHYMSLVRPRNAEAFDSGEFAFARALIPHLRRASELSTRLRQADLLSQTGLHALDMLSHGVILLDDALHIIHANAAAETLLRKADGIACEAGALMAARSGGSAQLHAALASVIGTAPSARSLRLGKRSGGAPLVLLALPFAHEAHWSLPRRPAALVCITDPDRGAHLPVSQLIELFGLTGKEAELAIDLLAGGELREIADRRGRSLATMRTHLTRLLAKTSVNRQSDLMRLLASLPRPGS